ncbi:hypothetical protein [Gymnodinialimonas sp. 57CJ19]|uniref:hypothetical protein n=1 Tax=Gymnodinialimonas sp. 57CJ19 TaxID=3138498 RepID=UPI0031344F51
MRARQLARIMSAHSSDALQVISRSVITHNRALRALSISALPNDVVFMVPKQVLWYWTEADFEKLHAKARAVIVDYVDSNIDAMHACGIDVHLSTSFVGEQALTKWIAQTNASGVARTLLHNVDERLQRLPPKNNAASLEILYVGSPRSTHLPDAARTKMRVLEGGTPKEFAAARMALTQANAHFCVRPDPSHLLSRKYKPFTKGFTAAWCGASMLVNRSVDDAELLLGSDYPFMIDTPSDKDIIEGIQHMEDAVGGPEWLEALDRGRTLADRVSPQNLAVELENIVREVAA